ncbi:uncharacterized protein [Eurosta solidaginis]|uniref:uncharacterized protein n=1 Tax=Eurosta solidaginis TaxID=178769 RepID=UPI003531740C
MEINKKYARTTPSQMRLYVAYCRDHPELLQGKNCPTSPNQVQRMREELTSKLNAMVGPSRTCDTWRESLGNWRKQLRSRARKFSAERRKTGSGQNPVAELTNFEQQALEVFGIAAVEGHSTSRLGFQNANNAENVHPTPEELPLEIPPPAFAEDPNEFASFCLVVSESPS